KVMVDGELVLMDYCPDLGYYRCDVTRQWPVNGKFSPVQRELYGFYLGAYEAVLYSIKPNITARDVVKAALPKMEKILAETKFSKPIYENAAKQFVERYRRMANPDTVAANQRRGASLGHAVGMATHDFGGGSDVLRPGPVFSIEPELRVPEEQIYIRLEDMIVITESGAQITSDFVPRSIDAVEKTIAESGLLQTYGRIKER
ncbi:MAG TPA: M24 family metallopeptidase, partial [Gemmatimonadaceae bacterium]|nr:M24 family metallopeptidase [Gemmatimonadaceae bacterium]